MVNFDRGVTRFGWVGNGGSGSYGSPLSQVARSRATACQNRPPPLFLFAKTLKFRLFMRLPRFHFRADALGFILRRIVVHLA